MQSFALFVWFLNSLEVPGFLTASYWNELKIWNTSYKPAFQMVLELWWVRPSFASPTVCLCLLLTKSPITTWLKNTDRHLTWSPNMYLQIYFIYIYTDISKYIYSNPFYHRPFISDSLCVSANILCCQHVWVRRSYFRGYSLPQIPSGDRSKISIRLPRIYCLLSKSHIRSMFSMYEMKVIFKAHFYKVLQWLSC